MEESSGGGGGIVLFRPGRVNQVIQKTITELRFEIEIKGDNPIGVQSTKVITFF